MLTLTIQEKVSREQLNTLPCGLYELSEPPKKIKDSYYDFAHDVTLDHPAVIRNFANVLEGDTPIARCAARLADEAISRKDGKLVFIQAIALEAWQPKTQCSLV